MTGTLLLVGCGESPTPTASVSGTVTLDNNPVAGVATLQSGESGKVFTGILDSSGKFTIEAVDVGNYKVYLSPPQITTPPEGPEDARNQPQSEIPDGYLSMESTDLKAVVEEGKENTYTFALNASGPTGAGPGMTPP